MRLSDKDIEIWIKKKKLIIDPVPCSKLIHGVTVDIRLGNQFYTFSDNITHIIDLSKSKEELSYILKNVMNKKKILSNKDTFLLKPGKLALAMTLESIIIPNNLVGWIDGRSSLARLGLMIHATSHRVDPGWKGHLVLECFNSGSIVLSLCPGMLIGALSFEVLSSSSIRPYNLRKTAKYCNQKGVTFSRLDRD